MNQSHGIALRLAKSGSGTFEYPADLPGVLSAQIAERLGEGPVTLDELHVEYPDDLPAVYFLIQHLWQRRAIQLVNRSLKADISVEPVVFGEPLTLLFSGAPGLWKLSRFTCARRGDDGDLILENPRKCARVTFLRAPAVRVLFELLSPVSSVDLVKRLSWLPDEQAAQDLVNLLQVAAIVDPCEADGTTPEDVSPELMQWEFHDLLFHTRSRLGRHDGPMGAHFRFKGKLDHQPTIKPNRWAARALPLFQPTAADISISDMPFSYVLESRRSIRAYNEGEPISARQLGEFLYRTARNRYHFSTEIGDFASRPYPSGGASYELELYLTINKCQGIERGFYYYDPEHHTLSLISGPNADVEDLLDDAWISAAQLCRPQVLITIASRFQRVAWKYSGMAYATQLKNTGVLFQTFYLVATAMNLAGCALGLGNSSRFCKLAQTNFLEEGSIGEFMLGNPA